MGYRCGWEDRPDIKMVVREYYNRPNTNKIGTSDGLLQTR